MSISSETILFVGAGATAQLGMPTTEQQARILFDFCDAPLSSNTITAESFKQFRDDIVDLLKILDFNDEDIGKISSEQKETFTRTFPGLTYEAAVQRTIVLRQEFDWPALKNVAKICKGNSPMLSKTFLQEVYDLIDVLLREDRGLDVRRGDYHIFLPTRRLVAGRKMMVYLMHTMFACAYQSLIKTTEGTKKFTGYQNFAKSLALLMQKEAKNNTVVPLNQRLFYLFSYTVFTTNFDPIFLWLLYFAHYQVNRHCNVFVGSPSKKVQLMLDFPNTVGMRKPAEKGEKLNHEIWYPITEAAVQKINDSNHSSDRIIRIGKYYFLHGSSNFRQCPRCGRLTLHIGDRWDCFSPTLFPPGITKNLAWNVQPRTNAEQCAYHNGEYDAVECLFCGELTHAQDNFIHTQTHFKGKSPSFIKEITDQALADLPSAKHVVLLGYSFPTDDAIWYADFTAMLNLSETHRVYCSVVCGYDGSDDWKYGSNLIEHLEKYGKEENRDQYGCNVIENAIRIFGKDYVRAYTGGIPQVFHNGDMETVIELLYPHKYPWNKTGFNEEGVTRQ